MTSLLTILKKTIEGVNSGLITDDDVCVFDFYIDGKCSDATQSKPARCSIQIPRNMIKHVEELDEWEIRLFAIKKEALNTIIDILDKQVN